MKTDLSAENPTLVHARLVVVDDHKFVRDFLVNMLAKEPGLEVVGIAENGIQAVERARELRPDVMVMDIGMPGLSGVEATRTIASELPDTRVLALSMHADPNYVEAMLKAGAHGYLLKDNAFDELTLAIRAVCAGHTFVSPAVAAAATAWEARVGVEHLPTQGDRTSVVSVVTQIVEMRDPNIAAHQRRVAALAAAIARRLGMSAADIRDITAAALIHDAGRLAVPADILAKTGPLTPVERKLVQTHAAAGYHVVLSANLEGPVADLVHQHHERSDGTGYPQGLSGSRILPGARVIAVADVVEAMTSHRPYRPAFGIESALEEIGSSPAYDSEVAAACLAVFREDGFFFDVDTDVVAASVPDAGAA